VGCGFVGGHALVYMKVLGFFYQFSLTQDKPLSLWWVVTGLALEGVLWTNRVASRNLATGDEKRSKEGRTKKDGGLF